MTTKDHKVFAEMLRQARVRGPQEGDVISYFVGLIGEVLYHDNPRFDWDKFKKACE